MTTQNFGYAMALLNKGYVVSTRSFNGHWKTKSVTSNQPVNMSRMGSVVLKSKRKMDEMIRCQIGKSK
jgi:hypothetical protein